MARNYVPQISEYPYHITARCPNRDAFRTEMHVTWKIFEHYLNYMNFKYELRIHSFVLMPNHFHLIAKTSSTPIGSIMRELLCGTSKEMNLLTSRINQNWGSRHYKSLLESQNYFFNTYKYVYQNPVRAKLVSRCEEWPYSTLHQTLGLSKLEFPLESDTLLFNPEFDSSELEWLNSRISKEDLEDIRWGLQRTKFKLPYQRYGKIHSLEAGRA